MQMPAVTLFGAENLAGGVLLPEAFSEIDAIFIPHASDLRFSQVTGADPGFSLGRG